MCCALGSIVERVSQLSSSTMDVMTYNDVHVNFTQEEWALLDPSQKNFYRDMMVETYMNLIDIGYNWEDHKVEEHCQSSQRYGRYIIYHSGYKPYEHRDIERSNIPLHLRTIRRYVVLMLSRFAECNSSLQVISFPASMGIHQQTHCRKAL
ncbi:zinc finger protein 431-like [Peromyscus californicus insignis]|uniref:zinc finger protein 431-like n=1 Tax=Peromyscus californicus insignis TaxID=564181 RepID=UPI0022A79D31|nr:zinc finger protein 431-like [Peromyscus californicus insignis]